MQMGGDMSDGNLLVLLDLTEDEGLILEGVVREIGGKVQKRFSCQYRNASPHAPAFPCCVAV